MPAIILVFRASFFYTIHWPKLLIHLWLAFFLFLLSACSGNDTRTPADTSTAQEIPNSAPPSLDDTHIKTKTDNTPEIYALELPTSEETVSLGDPIPPVVARGLTNSDTEPTPIPIDEVSLVLTSNAPTDEHQNTQQMGSFKQEVRLKQNPTIKVERDIIVQHPQCRSNNQSKTLSHCLRFSENQQVPATQYSGSQFIESAATIEASQTVCSAPCGIHFSANLDTSVFSVDHTWNDVAYSWDFDDAKAVFQSLPDNFTFGRSANYAQGPVSAHVFNQPGHYKVSLQIAEQDGKFSTAFKDIIVTDADAAYPQQKTLCLSKKSDFSGCPAGSQLFTNWEQAIAVFASNQKDNSYRLLLKAGETFATKNSIILSRNGPYFISRYGEGANPIIQAHTNVSVFHALRVKGLTITSVEIQGNYDSHTGLGNSYATKAINTTSSDNITIYQTQSSGIGNHALITGGQGIVIADNSVTNWHDYASLSQGWDEDKNGIIDEHEYANNIAYIGNHFKQSENAISGTGNKGGQAPRWADHGPIRSAGSFQFLVSQNDLRSTTGWSSSGQAHQPALRYNQSGVPNHSGVINRNRLSGGWIVLQLSPQNTLHTACLGKLLVERNHLIGSGNTIYMTRISYGDTTLRNNILELPDVQDDGNMLPFTSMIDVDFGPSTEKNQSKPKRIYGNTLVQMQSNPAKDSFAFIDKSDTSSNLESTSIITHLNMVYAPRASVRNLKNYELTNVAAMDEKKRPLIKQLKQKESVMGLFDGFYGQFRNPSHTNAGAVSMMPARMCSK